MTGININMWQELIYKTVVRLVRDGRRTDVRRMEDNQGLDREYIDLSSSCIPDWGQALRQLRSEPHFDLGMMHLTHLCLSGPLATDYVLDVDSAEYANRLSE